MAVNVASATTQKSHVRLGAWDEMSDHFIGVVLGTPPIAQQRLSAGAAVGRRSERITVPAVVERRIGRAQSECPSGWGRLDQRGRSSTESCTVAGPSAWMQRQRFGDALHPPHDRSHPHHRRSRRRQLVLQLRCGRRWLRGGGVPLSRHGRARGGRLDTDLADYGVPRRRKRAFLTFVRRASPAVDLLLMGPGMHDRAASRTVCRW